MIAWKKHVASLYENYILKIIIIKTNDNQIRMRIDKESGTRGGDIENILYRGFVSEQQAIKFAKKYMRTH